MAKLSSRFPMEVPADDMCEEPWSFVTRMPSQEICENLYQLIKGDEGQAQIKLLRAMSENEELKALTKNVGADKDGVREALTDPAVQSAILSAMGNEDLNRVLVGVPSAVRHQIALDTQQYCSQPEGIERDDGEAFTWETLREEVEFYADAALFSAAEQIVDRYKGDSGKAALKN